MLLGLHAGEFTVVAADGAVVFVCLFCGGQFGFDAGDGVVEVLLGEFTLPDGDDGPGEGVEALGIEFVAGDVACYFLLPEFNMGLRHDIFGAVAVAVPEAAVDEDDGAIFRQYQIRRSGQALVVEPVSVAAAPQFVPDGPLGDRVLRADAGHAVVPLGGSQAVGIMWHETTKTGTYRNEHVPKNPISGTYPNERVPKNLISGTYPKGRGYKNTFSYL